MGLGARDSWAGSDFTLATTIEKCRHKELDGNAMKTMVDVCSSYNQPRMFELFAIQSPLVVDTSTIIGEDRKTVFLPLTTVLLCIPCWGIAVFCLVLILTARLAPHSARSLVSASALAAPLLLAVISPVCWIVALIVAYRRNKFAVRVQLAGWVFVAASGIAMVCTWMVLDHFGRR